MNIGLEMGAAQGNPSRQERIGFSAKRPKVLHQKSLDSMWIPRWSHIFGTSVARGVENIPNYLALHAADRPIGGVQSYLRKMCPGSPPGNHSGRRGFFLVPGDATAGAEMRFPGSKSPARTWLMTWKNKLKYAHLRCTWINLVTCVNHTFCGEAYEAGLQNFSEMISLESSQNWSITHRIHVYGISTSIYYTNQSNAGRHAWILWVVGYDGVQEYWNSPK